MPLDLASVTTQTFVKGRAAYGGNAQSTAVVKLLEDLLETDLRADGFRRSSAKCSVCCAATTLP